MRKFLLYLGLLALVGLGVGYFMYNKPHQNIGKAKADVEMAATRLYAAFDNNEDEANAQYLDKIIQVSGKVREVIKEDNGLTSVTLDSGSEMFGVICQMDNLSDHKRLDFTEGEDVTLKGVCTGMLMDVILVRCVEL